VEGIDIVDIFIKKREEIIKRYIKHSAAIYGQREKIRKIVELIDSAENLHVYGKGRSGDIARSFARRLKHFRYRVWFPEDTVTERIREKDVVILFSGSGETADVITVAKEAKKAGATVISVTSFTDSTLAKYSDLIYLLPGGMRKKRGWDYLKAQLEEKEVYGGTEFENELYLFEESLLEAIGEYKKIPKSIIAEEHRRDELIE